MSQNGNKPVIKAPSAADNLPPLEEKDDEVAPWLPTSFLDLEEEIIADLKAKQLRGKWITKDRAGYRLQRREGWRPYERPAGVAEGHFARPNVDMWDKDGSVLEFEDLIFCVIPEKKARAMDRRDELAVQDAQKNIHRQYTESVRTISNGIAVGTVASAVDTLKK